MYEWQVSVLSQRRFIFLFTFSCCVATGIPFISRRPDMQPVVTSTTVTTTVGPEDVSVNRGQTLVMSAPTSGRPTPIISWHKNGEPISTRGRFTVQSNGRLEIRDITQDDAGSYVVQAANRVGVDQESINVNVPSKHLLYLQLHSW